ncbi:MAG TPA: GNAT family N-acetyltransferase [Actinophytocola sp.]|nr:GNAT family N-acetyltransferase [Actinophytocola sp.]
MGEVFARTGRLLIRRFRLADVDVFTAYRSDPEVARYQSWDAPFPAADAQRLVAEFAVADERAAGWFQYALELRTTRALIGDVAVNRHGDRAELGFTLARAYQGQGYATEAVRCVLDRVFQEGVRTVIAEFDPPNEASRRLLERVGFRCGEDAGELRR